MRVRGLKPDDNVRLSLEKMVAPHAGAWIETDVSIRVCYPNDVAPHAGAWIET